MKDKLLDELTCLPMAIAQAAAYPNMNRTTIAKYLRLLRNTELDLVNLMSEEFRDDTRYRDSANAVARTWVVSFSQLRERDAVAADLVAFMSCVEWKAIPRSLLPRTQSGGQAEISEGRMENAIGALCGYSFLARRGEDRRATQGGSEDGRGSDESEEETEAEEWYDIHRLVHLATRVWVKKHGDVSEVAEAAVRRVAGVFPSDDYEIRALWRAYLPHALRLLGGARDRKAEELSELSELSLLVGRCLRVDGRIGEAVVSLEKSCQQRSKRSEDDSDRLSSQHVLAMAYQADGQVQKAVELLEAVVKARETLATDHTDRLASLHALAMAYDADGQVKKDVDLLESVVEIKTRVLRADHPSLLVSVEVLADIYADLAVDSDEALSPSSLGSPTTAGSAQSVM